jgi:hypothetical protein
LNSGTQIDGRLTKSRAITIAAGEDHGMVDRGNPGAHADRRGHFDADLGGDLARWFASDSPLEQAGFELAVPP